MFGFYDDIEAALIDGAEPRTATGNNFEYHASRGLRQSAWQVSPLSPGEKLAYGRSLDEND
jgi:hypothetical protein